MGHPGPHPHVLRSLHQDGRANPTAGLWTLPPLWTHRPRPQRFGNLAQNARFPQRPQPSSTQKYTKSTRTRTPTSAPAIVQVSALSGERQHFHVYGDRSHGNAIGTGCFSPLKNTASGASICSAHTQSMPGAPETKTALIVVRTYPTPATKGVEVSCTAAITDQGEWLRLFPVPYRRLKPVQRFHKYQWIDVEVEKSSDARPESFRISRQDY